MSAGHGAPSGDGQTRRQVVKFTFYKVDPSWRLLPPEERERGKRELCQVVEAFGDRLLVRSYSLAGLRGDADFLLWLVADQMEEFQALATQIFSTAMGPYLSMPYSYFSMTRRSIYRTPEEGRSADARLRVQPAGAKYLFVYPFVKTRPWYELPKDVRQQMMDEHIAIGRKYPSVKLNTTYSYGLDDQEFVVSFETDNASDFLDLVMELRETKASSYTLRDTPTFTCVAMPLRDALDAVGAPGDVALAGEATPAARDGWSPVAQVAQLTEEGASVIYFGGEQVALFRINGRIYAVSNRCSHANGPLAEGPVDGSAVTCPWHGSQFDLATGQPVAGPAQRPVRTYQVRVEDGTVLLARGEVPAPVEGPS
jgi:chlorite dismutase